MAESDQTQIDLALARYLDGDPEPSDGFVLAEAMRDAPEFAQEVIRLLTLDDLLRQFTVPDDQAFLESLKLRMEGDCEGGEFTESFERRLRGLEVPLHTPYRLWLPWMVAAAACLVALVIGVLGAWRPGFAPPLAPGVAVDGGRVLSAGDRFRELAPASGLAMVVKLDGMVWVPREGPHPAEGEILPKGRLQFRSGRLTLSMLTGVVFVVEGPADFDLVALDKVFCRQGRLRARVPKGAEGFVVASAKSAVVDLGTEFGLNVEPDGRSRVMVFEGMAEAALLDAAGSPRRTQLVEKSQAFELDPMSDRIAESVARPEGFVSTLELPAPALLLAPGYAAMVMHARPRGYWRFESLSAGLIPNETPGGSPLRLSGPIRVTGTRRGNGCAWFQAGASEQFLSMVDRWEVAGASECAIEFWFHSDVFSHASLVGLLPPEEFVLPGQISPYVHTLLVELTAQERQSLNKPASVRFLHRWPIDTKVGSNAFSKEVYVPRRWHHVVVQKNRDRMELYFDGVPETSMPIATVPPTMACRLVVGRRTPDQTDPADVRPFVGRLDELAIYDRRLADEEVRRHFQAASQRLFTD